MLCIGDGALGFLALRRQHSLHFRAMLRACMFCVLSSSLALHMGSFAAGAQPPQPLSPRRAPRPSLVAASMSAADASLPGAPQSQEAPAPAPRESTLSQIVMQIRGGDKIRGRTFVLPAIIAALLVGFQVTSALGAVAGLYALKLVYAGAIAGIISRSACAPLEMVSTVMMCKGGESGGMRAELKKAWKADGIQGLFKGNGANCLKVAPSRGTQFLVYEYVKRLLVTYGWFGLVPGAPLGALPRLCAGGIAGMVAAVIVYPLEVVKTLRTVFPDECTGIYETIDCVVQKGGGIAGLYRGLVPTLIAMFPYVGVEFMVYETLKRYWEVRITPPRTSAAARPPAAPLRALPPPHHAPVRSPLLLLRSADVDGHGGGDSRAAPPRRDRRRVRAGVGAPARRGAPADADAGRRQHRRRQKGREGAQKDRQHVPGAVLDRQGRGPWRALPRPRPRLPREGAVDGDRLLHLRGHEGRDGRQVRLSAVGRADIGRGRRAAGPL